MSGKIEVAGIKIARSDWDAMPNTVQAVVKVLSERLATIDYSIA